MMITVSIISRQIGHSSVSDVARLASTFFAKDMLGAPEVCPSATSCIKVSISMHFELDEGSLTWSLGSITRSGCNTARRKLGTSC